MFNSDIYACPFTFTACSLVLGTEIQDVDQLVDCLKMKIPVLTSTLQLREEFEQEVRRTVGLLYIEDLSWPGLGVVRYIFQYFLCYVWIGSALLEGNK